MEAARIIESERTARVMVAKQTTHYPRLKKEFVFWKRDLKMSTRQAQKEREMKTPEEI